MPGNQDTMYRQWTMLRMIPREPHMRSTQQIYRQLLDEGFSVTDRTVARDLDKLSATFGFTNAEEGKVLQWYWPKSSKVLDVPGMEPSAALAWLISRDQLRKSLPSTAISHLTPYFDRAEAVLKEAGPSSLAQWHRKFRVCARGPALRVLPIPAGVMDAVSGALVTSRAIEAEYQSRGRSKATKQTLHPLALVLKDGVHYLVAAAGTFEHPVHYALHRVRSARMLDVPARKFPAFDLDTYVHQSFSYSLNADQIQVVLRFSREAGLHLLERPLADDQEAEESPDYIRITAGVADTAELCERRSKSA